MSSSNERLLKGIEQEFNQLKEAQPKNVVLDLSDPVTFVEKYVTLPEKAASLGNKTWFEQRPWLPPIYRDDSRRIVITKGRQMEVSEYAVNMLLYWALKRPGKYIYASASGDKADIFSHDRFQKQLSRSSDLQRLVKGQAVRRVVYGPSEVYFMTAFEDTKTLRSIDADMIVLDEIQDYRANAVAIAEEGLRHSGFGKLLAIGTPYLTGSSFDNLWEDSTRNEWNRETQKWEPANPKWEDALWAGYHISQEFAVGVWIPQKDFDYMRSHKPRQEFQNEVLGLFYSGLGRPTDRGYMLSLFSPALRKGDFTKGEFLISGVDWGVSKANTVFYVIRPRILELPDLYTIDTIYIERLDNPDPMKQTERIAQLLNTFPVSLCVLDYGSGFVQNSELYKQFGDRVMQVHLGEGRRGQPISIEPTQFGPLAEVNRTWALDTTMDYVTRPERFRFYNETDIGLRDWIISDFLSEYPEMSSTTGKKIWIHNTDTTDDCLMAFVNAMIGFQLRKTIPITGNPNEWVSFV